MTPEYPRPLSEHELRWMESLSDETIYPHAAAEIRALRARLAAAEGALRPFAKLGIHATWADDETLGLVTIRVGDIRRARAALAPIQPAPAVPRDSMGSAA